MKLKILKFILVLLTLLPVQVVYSQALSTAQERWKPSTELAQQHFATAVHLEQSDSLKAALPLYHYVALSDSTSEVGKRAIAKLDSIWTIEHTIFQEQLLGTWNWIWSGTNWGTENSPTKCQCQKSWTFTTDEVIIFKDKKAVDRFSYHIEKDYGRLGSGHFMLQLNKGEKRWRLSIPEQVDNAFFIAESSNKTNVFLSFREEGLVPNCSCGCPEQGFEKNR